MRIAVIGGMGAVAQELIVQAMEEGHFVSWYIKPTDELPDRTLEGDKSYAQVLRIVRGNWDNENKYNEVMDGCDAVAVALDIQHTKPEQFVPTQKLVQKAMWQNNIKRIILVTSHGADESSRNLDWGFWAKLNINQVLYIFNIISLCWSVVAQYTEQERVLRNDKLVFTILRPATITDGPFTGTYLATPQHVFGGYISAADVADCILKALNHDMDVAQSFSIAYSSRVA
ncbi:hypothetical protein COEREDRAFT_86212 [Coemansia reversa NRRL 1564]|uniref:NAD(P)-binding domain-containing protein n=1 Tax=Coemansia reversa (strain ATCC 12441 / NRRL 1564) TaxID=763665 RepID=A0A2G5BES3_COERN|nr:hypothetical protein COEREDRAFT_86212 [Coemansia reversa NRRL 1564]|eukprot:PIA17207.1 hypothetical protein COEREDRAFT_86212 [Coemansia reversa NRRL 1564]